MLVIVATAGHLLILLLLPFLVVASFSFFSNVSLLPDLTSLLFSLVLANYGEITTCAPEENLGKDAAPTM